MHPACEAEPVAPRLSEEQDWILYPNGMGYSESIEFVRLLFELVINKAIELILQRIDHLR